MVQFSFELASDLRSALRAQVNPARGTIFRCVYVARFDPREPVQ
jgi:hypothetical protein